MNLSPAAAISFLIETAAGKTEALWEIEVMGIVIAANTHQNWTKRDNIHTDTFK
jgi:hypothetical protein